MLLIRINGLAAEGSRRAIILPKKCSIFPEATIYRTPTKISRRIKSKKNIIRTGRFIQMNKKPRKKFAQAIFARTCPIFQEKNTSKIYCAISQEQVQFQESFFQIFKRTPTIFQETILPRIASLDAFVVDWERCAFVWFGNLLSMLL